MTAQQVEILFTETLQIIQFEPQFFKAIVNLMLMHQKYQIGSTEYLQFLSQYELSVIESYSSTHDNMLRQWLQFQLLQEANE